MNQPAHDPEAVALSKIYALLIRKSNEQKAKKGAIAEGTATATIQGFDDSPGSIEVNHHDK